MVLLDLKKAFDSVWHGSLIYNYPKLMSQLFLLTFLIKIILSYLSNTTFIVNFQGERFSPIEVASGVPQGVYPWTYFVQHLYK